MDSSGIRGFPHFSLNLTQEKHLCETKDHLPKKVAPVLYHCIAGVQGHDREDFSVEPDGSVEP